MTAGRRAFRADIQGLRGAAILLIIAYHAKVPGFSGGYIGVDVFFVLSGYLITLLLFDEAVATGSVSLLQFYARRIRRLFPALFVMLAATIGATMLLYAPFEHAAVAIAASSAAGYVSNVHFAHGAIGYLAAGQTDRNPLLHTWSLSVEEQFYVFWPVILVLAIGRVMPREPAVAAKRLLICLATLGGASFILSLWWTQTEPQLAFYTSLTRAWEFSAGGIAALLPIAESEVDSIRVIRRPQWLVGVAAMAAALVIVAASMLYKQGTPFPGVAAVFPVMSTAFLLFAGRRGGSIAPLRVLSTRPMQALGRISYSWYLWHWPVLILGSVFVRGWPWQLRGLLVLFSLLLGAVSYHVVEQRVRFSPWLLQRPRTCVAGGIACSAILVLCGFAWRTASIEWSATPGFRQIAEARTDLPSLYREGCDAQWLETAVIACAYGAAVPAHVAVLVGDSHAAQWSSALRSALPLATWRILVITKASCPMVDVSYRLDELGRRYSECDEWRTRVLRMITQIQPSLTVVGSADRYHFTTEQWRTGSDRVLRVVSAASARVVLLRDVPRPEFDVPACIGRAKWSPVMHGTDCTTFAVRDPTLAFAAERGVAVHYPNVTILDAQSAFCPSAHACRTVRDGMILFRDTNHITDTFARVMAPDLARAAGVIVPTKGATSVGLDDGHDLRPRPDRR